MLKKGVTMLKERTTVQRAAIIGAGSLSKHIIDAAKEEFSLLAKFLYQTEIRALNTGGGGGAPLMLAQTFMNECSSMNGGVEVYGFSPWRNRDMHIAAGSNWPIDDLRIHMEFIGGAEEGDFGRRDHQTLKGCDHLLLLGFGNVGAGTGRELFRALKMKSVRHIAFVQSSSMTPPEHERFVMLHECAQEFRKPDVNVTLLSLNALTINEAGLVVSKPDHASQLWF